MPAGVTNSGLLPASAAAAAAAADAGVTLFDSAAGSLKLPRDFCHPEAYPAGTRPGDDVTLIFFFGHTEPVVGRETRAVVALAWGTDGTKQQQKTQKNQEAVVAMLTVTNLDGAGLDSGTTPQSVCTNAGFVFVPTQHSHGYRHVSTSNNNNTRFPPPPGRLARLHTLPRIVCKAKQNAAGAAGARVS